MFVISLLGYVSNLSLLSKAALLIVTAILLFLAAFCYKVFVTPKLIAKHYIAQGIKTCYFQKGDPTKVWNDLALKKGTCFYPWTEFVHKNPEAPAFITNLGPFVHLQLVDPALVKEFYQQEFEKYGRSGAIDLLEVLFENAMPLIPFAPWKARRRIYSQAFHYEFLKDNLPTIEDHAIRFCNNIHPSKLKTFKCWKETKNYPGLIAGQLFFGQDLSNVLVEGESMVQYLVGMCDRLLISFSSLVVFLFGKGIIHTKIFPSHRELLRRKAVFRETCRKLIEKKERELSSDPNAKNQDNLLHLFLKAKSDPETKLNDSSIISEFMAFFFVGVDTSSTLISSSYFYLAAYPEVTKKIREEIAAHWKLGQPLTMDIINKLDYLHAFLKEVLRISPVAFMGAQRETTKDHKLGNLHIKKGTIVVAGGFSMYYHPKFYKNPYEFDPMRFLRKDSDELFNTDPFIFLPFSSGKRNCIGQHLAYLETKVLLIHLLSRYDISLPKDYPHAWTLQNGFYTLLEPLTPILTPRE